MGNESQKNGQYVACAECGALIYKKLSLLKRNHKHHFCSQACSGKFRTEIQTETRICEFCKSEMRVKKSEKKRFCCPECQHEWQKTRIGRDNPKYRRVPIACKTCGRMFDVQRYKVNNENLFCSKECKVKWFTEVWSQREEWKEESSRRSVALLKDGKIPTSFSKPHQAVVQMLELLGVKYACEYPVTYYLIDIFLVDSNLMIEVMGDFWHCNPIKYEVPRYENQTKAIRRDRAKHTYVLKYYGIEILYLWENDINEHADVCAELIKKYISCGGTLEDYNSFNYSILDDQLVLNNELLLVSKQEKDAYNIEDAC